MRAHFAEAGAKPVLDLRREAKKHLEALLEVCPNHEEGRRMLAEVRDKLRAIMGEAEKLSEAIQAAEAARRGLADELARVRERYAALEAEAEDVKALALLADQARTLHFIES